MTRFHGSGGSHSQRCPAVGTALAMFSLIATTASAQSTQFQRATCAGPDPTAAIRACTDLLDFGNLDDESKVGTYVNRGNAYDSVKEPDRALADYGSALAINPRSAEAHRNKGATLNRLGRRRDALTEFEAAVELKPDYAYAYMSRAEVLVALPSGSPEERRSLHNRAIADLTTAIGLGLDQFQEPALVQRGTLYLDGDQIDDAIADFDQVLRLNPTSFGAFAVRGMSLFKKGEYTRAIGDWNESLKLDPSVLGLLYCRGVAKRLNGDRPGGDAEIEAAKARRPTVTDEMAGLCVEPLAHEPVATTPSAPTAAVVEPDPAVVARMLVERRAVVDVPPKGKAERDIKLTDQAYAMPGGESRVVLFRLPEYRAPYVLTVKSYLVKHRGFREGLFMPTTLILDANFRITRTIAETDLQSKGEGLTKGPRVEATIPIAEAQRSDRYVLMYTHAGGVGVHIDRARWTLAEALFAHAETSADGNVEVETKPTK